MSSPAQNPVWEVQLPPHFPRTNFLDAVLVTAASAADALVAATQAHPEVPAEVWAVSTATEKAGLQDYEGVTFTVAVAGGAGSPYEYVGLALDGPDEVATALTALLFVDFAGMASTGNVITSTGATDGLGATAITASASVGGTTLTGLAPAVSATGISSIDRTITLSTGGQPTVVGKVAVEDQY